MRCELPFFYNSSEPNLCPFPVFGFNDQAQLWS
jgi:hypothetical protein